jgi:hypothetical protein
MTAVGVTMVASAGRAKLPLVFNTAVQFEAMPVRTTVGSIQ